MMSRCDVVDLNYVPQLYRRALDGITGFGENHHFSAVFTRTGHVHPDLLGSGERPNIIPLAYDAVTRDVVIWGTHNGQVLGIQPHPEIGFPDDDVVFRESLTGILYSLVDEYGRDIYNILDNFEGDTPIQNTAAHFYTFALLAFVNDILRQQRAHTEKNPLS